MSVRQNGMVQKNGTPPIWVQPPLSDLPADFLSRRSLAPSTIDVADGGRVEELSWARP